MLHKRRLSAADEFTVSSYITYASLLVALSNWSPSVSDRMAEARGKEAMAKVCYMDVTANIIT